MTFLDHFGCKAVILDKDGTLLDTESINFEMYDRLLRRYRARHDITTHARMMGRADFENLRTLQELHPSFPQGEERLESLRAEQWELYAAVQREYGIRPMPGAALFLEYCQRQHIPLAVATSARRNDTTAQFDELGWHVYFQAVITAEDVPFHKPNPDVYLEAANRLNIPPRECLAFEDGPNGVIAALTAGMQVIFVRDPRFKLHVPDGVSRFIEHLDKILDDKHSPLP